MPLPFAAQDSFGWLLFRTGKREEALVHLQKSMQLIEEQNIAAQAPEQAAETMAHLGEVYWHLDQREQARAVWDKALAQFPESAIVQETRRRLDGAAASSNEKRF